MALITLVAYARACDGPFQFDDHLVIRAHEEGYLSTVAGFVSFARTRLLPFATLGLNYWAGGDEPFGYHAVNVAIHLLATFLVFELALSLCLTPRLRDSQLAANPLPFAVAAAVLFACHPIQVQAVTYVVQRASSLAAMFYVGSVLLYVRARNAQLGAPPGRVAPSLVGSGLFALGAFLSKENTASLPLAILLTEWVFYRPRSNARQALQLTPYLLLVLVIPLLWSLLAEGPPLGQSSGSPAERVIGLGRLLLFRANPDGDVTALDYLRTQCVVIPRYLRLVGTAVGLQRRPRRRAAARPLTGGERRAGIAGGAIGVRCLRRAALAGHRLRHPVVLCRVERRVERAAHPRRHGGAPHVSRHARHRPGGG